MAPRVKGSKLQVTPGAERFAALDAEAQRRVLGPAAYEAYRDGAFDLSDLVGRTHSERWGDGLRVRSLGNVVGAERAAGYVERGRVRAEILAALTQAPTTAKGLVQVDRLVEVRTMEQGAVRALMEEIRKGDPLPKLAQHWREHGNEFTDLGVADEDDYAEYLKRHVERLDLRLFTFVTSKSTGDRMWIAVGMDNGVVAQYNETKATMWSLFRQPDVSRYLEAGRGWWVEAFDGGDIGIWFEPC